MDGKSKTKNPNPSSGSTKRKEKNDQFEFCKVCKLNHNQGRRHNYFPNHVKSLSSFLSRFQSKISDVRFFVKNPSLLRPEFASRNRFWCVFCDFEAIETGSSFVCDNAINHLASVDHLKNLKSFMWKYGGGMDRIDRFRVSEEDIAKYEKKCMSLKSEDASEQSRGPLIGPSNDIHNESKFKYVDNVDESNISYHDSSFPNGVVPLQNHTNEKYQVSHPELSGVAGFGISSLDNGSLLASPPSSTNIQCSAGGNFLAEANLHNGAGKMHQIYAEKKAADGEGNSGGFPKLTRISSKVNDELGGNVHSGAPPPWFDANNGILDPALNPGQGTIPVTKTGKSKLNPKRVGAAWAERRKIEMEMERRGQLPANRFDANWLPNFGRVWQSGSRKESRKEFEGEAKQPQKDENQPEISVQLQPYISKRMRREANE